MLTIAVKLIVFPKRFYKLTHGSEHIKHIPLNICSLIKLAQSRISEIVIFNRMLSSYSENVIIKSYLNFALIIPF